MAGWFSTEARLHSSPFPGRRVGKFTKSQALGWSIRIGYTFGLVINRRKIHIEWGDCDPAQIVYFPRYLEYFDGCTAALFAKAGFSKREMLKAYEIVGFPVVEVNCRFMAPSRFSDDVEIESAIIKWGTSSFCVHHGLFRGETLAVECQETRVWSALSSDDPEKIESRPIPREVIERLSR